jgi:hypothetical protein
MDLGSLLFLVALSYGMGVFWYSLIPGRMPDTAWRVAAYPFLASAIAEALFSFGPALGGIHVLVALVASLVGVIVDWIITDLRHYRIVAEPRSAGAQA